MLKMPCMQWIANGFVEGTLKYNLLLETGKVRTYLIGLLCKELNI